MRSAHVQRHRKSSDGVSEVHKQHRRSDLPIEVGLPDCLVLSGSSLVHPPIRVLVLVAASVIGQSHALVVM
jgi:hypothetical protein